MTVIANEVANDEGAIVPRGTNTPTLDNFVERYRNLTQRSAADIIELGAVVLDAERTLNGPQLETFCERVKLKRKGATYRKHRAIGEAEAELRPLIGSLPSNWTTLYQLARLGP